MKPTVISLLLLIALSVGCGYGTHSTTPAQPGTTPAIAQLMPNSAISGGSNFTLTVNGTNFAAAAVVNWNGQAQTTTFISATQVTATIPSSAIATPATVPVTVTNPGVAGGIYGGGTLAETSTAVNFVVN